MAQDLDKLKRTLEKKVCLVQFECLKSGETKTREMTTNPKFTKVLNLRQINKDPIKIEIKIISFDMEFMN